VLSLAYGFPSVSNEIQDNTAAQCAAIPTLRHLPNSLLDEKFRSAAFVVIESGLGIVLIRRAKALNKSAKIIYRASDKLDTIGAPDRLQTELRRTMSSIDYICLLAAKMASNFAWAGNKRFLVPLAYIPGF